jgi:hypothetical protein
MLAVKLHQKSPKCATQCVAKLRNNSKLSLRVFTYALPIDNLEVRICWAWSNENYERVLWCYSRANVTVFKHKVIKTLSRLLMTQDFSSSLRTLNFGCRSLVKTLGIREAWTSYSLSKLMLGYVQCRMLRKEELCGLHSYELPRVIGVVKRRRLQWAEHAAGIGRSKRCLHRMLVGKPRLGISTWEDNIKMDEREKRFWGWKMNLNGLAPCPMVGFGINGIEPPGFAVTVLFVS